ncbi:MAG: hypothetical protein ACRDO9_08850, partial [Gaiellales bacterium]
MFKSGLRLRARARRKTSRTRPVSSTARSPAKGGCEWTLSDLPRPCPRPDGGWAESALVADITYIAIATGFVYMAAILDA